MLGDTYWTIHGLFYGPKTFSNYIEAVDAFENAGTTWDSDEIRLLEHKVIKVKKNPSGG